MSPLRPTPVALALGLAFAGTAVAQPATPGADTALTLGQVVVSSGASGPLEARRLLTSVDILPGERIESQVAQNNWELFGQVPGVMLTQFGQGTTSGKFSMRAFNGEGEINAVKLLVDGVPSNSNDGNMPYIDLAPRLDIDAVRRLPPEDRGHLARSDVQTRDHLIMRRVHSFPRPHEDAALRQER